MSRLDRLLLANALWPRGDVARPADLGAATSSDMIAQAHTLHRRIDQLERELRRRPTLTLVDKRA